MFYHKVEYRNDTLQRCYCFIRSLTTATATTTATVATTTTTTTTTTSTYFHCYDTIIFDSNNTWNIT